MYVIINQQFRDEALRYSLKACCEDCRHFSHERIACAMTYPVENHIKKTFEEAKDSERIYFCKMFEVDDA